MPIIWRIEDAETMKGAYASGAAQYSNIGNQAKRHPTPHNDVMLREIWDGMKWIEQDRWFFGFASIAQYKAWFFNKSARKRLAEYSGRDSRMVLRKYKVSSNDFHRGMNQAIFRREKAVLLEERAPDFC